MIYLLTRCHPLSSVVIRCHPFSVYSFVSNQTINLIVTALKDSIK
ncbi:hypothetical protein CFJ40_26075 [Salmonella enterica]|nr:hypothetical protein [Salmonella enterica]